MNRYYGAIKALQFYENDVMKFETFNLNETSFDAWGIFLIIFTRSNSSLR